MSGSASHVLERFPDHWQEITELLRTSDAFGFLCEDYAVAVTALRAWEVSADPKAPVRRPSIEISWRSSRPRFSVSFKSGARDDGRHFAPRLPARPADGAAREGPEMLAQVAGATGVEAAWEQVG